ncbi:MAG TPA: alpha/beta hydrolase [Kofleriaceae bacterium]|nr:alpha/beta hydrolase [Kofleriaceae bacterium]
MRRSSAVSSLALTLVSILGLVACGGDGGTAPDLSVETAGAYEAGVVEMTLTDDARQRELTLQLWYPALAEGGGGSIAIADFADPAHRAAFTALVEAADPACTTRTIAARWTPAPAPGPFPLIAFSHCHECTRFSSMTVAARLASHGFAVVTVDHTGNTLWDQIDMDGLPLDTTTLELRVADLAFAIDHAAELAQGAAVRLDSGPIGVFGHSFGSVTAGLYAQRNATTVGAAFGLAAPMENPLLPGVTITSLPMPLGFLVAREDNSITELGNELIRGNYMRAPGPAWKLEVADAGHWSVSDLVGVVDGFAPGCGAGERQTDGSAFTYLDAATGRGIAASYVTAFFKATLAADAGAQAYLEAGRPSGTVTAEHR